MGSYVAGKVSQLMTKKNIQIRNSNILIMGLTFKENCPDIRNTRVVNLIEELKSFRCNVEVYDPWAHKEEAFIEYGIQIIDTPLINNYDAIVLAVAHDEFKELSLDQIKSFGRDTFVLYDIKYILKAEDSDGRL